ncbi:hypothetical protein HRW07_02720 [Streptomyces lunaelactis]|uniref:hypothetical protein n=1 Tax=Streptomyces lunaelactis TaxID=1535768 RepID=UPI0015853EB5|nr:hypothetical protein [Streptomyces lunaelactis]NUL02174.1 hypothetical protein [Streptomyces lunaelactis]
MSKTDPTPSLDDVRETLANIVRLVERGSVDHWPNPVLRELALALLRKLLKLTDHAQRSMRDAELAETQAVYGLVAHKASELLALPEAAVYRAVVSMCEKVESPTLTDGLPPLDPGVADRLSRFLVRIVVVYRGHEGDRDTPQRTVRLVHGHSPGDLRETEISQNVGYERLPDDVRVDLMKGIEQVQFQLFPGRA